MALKNGSASWGRAKKVLCVRLDNAGDVLMTVPAMRALKAFAPGRRLSLLASSQGSTVAPLLPELSETIVYDAPWVKCGAQRCGVRADRDMAGRLRARRFDAAVIFTVYSQNPLPAAFLCYLAGIPFRLAYCHENPYGLLTHWVQDPEPHAFIRHEVRRQLDLVAKVGCRSENEALSLTVPAGAKERVLGMLARRGLKPGAPWIVMHTGASAPSRRYPPEHFARTARILSEKWGYQIVFTGTRAEAETVEKIRSRLRMPSISLAGALSIAELAALLSLSPLLISNNTGPVHIASAVGTRVVDIYALTNPQHTPWGVEHRVLYKKVPCRYCYKSVCPVGSHECLRLVPPEDVARAAHELIGSALS